MSDDEYSNHTIIRYKQAINSIKILYEDKFNKTIQLPESLDENTNEIIDILKGKYELATIINSISAIIWYLSNINDNSYSIEYINTIKEKYRVHARLIKESIDQNKIGKEFQLTEREQKTFMKWEDVLEFYIKLSKQLDKTDYKSFLEFVIISLYVLHPPVRADYANMRVFIDESFIPDNFTENYCVLQTNPRFVFNKYKTAKHKGVTDIPIDPQLHDILLDWLEINPSNYLLSSYVKCKSIFKPFTEVCLCRRITLIFNKYTNVPVTINTLRHSYISYLAKQEFEMITKKLDNANKMMHSVTMADKYRRMVYLS
jgi:hypothetical protein